MTSSHEHRRRDQYRRPAPAREAQAAEGHVRLHRGRGRGRARAGAQRGRVSQAPAVAALSRRCLEARPDADDFRPHLFEPVRHFADRRRRPLSAARRRVACWPRRRATANIPYIMSGGSNASMEEAARVAPDNTWFQMYAAKDATVTDALVGRARDNGLGALVLTVDVPVHPRRERNCATASPMSARGGVFEALKLKPSIIAEALTHPAWVYRYVTERRRADPRQLGAARPQRREQPRGPRVRPQPDPGLGADLARPRTLSPAVPAHADRQGHPEPGRRDPRRRDRLSTASSCRTMAAVSSIRRRPRSTRCRRSRRRSATG